MTEGNGKLPLTDGGANMALESYRYYCLDGAGHLNAGRWFTASSDKDAVSQVQAKHPEDQCEIWKGIRLVAELDPKCLNSNAPARHYG